VFQNYAKLGKVRGICGFESRYPYSAPVKVYALFSVLRHNS